MSRRRIITFSGRMRSGKGVLSRAMENAYGAQTFSMATHLKNLCMSILQIECPQISWNTKLMNDSKNRNDVLNETPIVLSEQSIKLISKTTGFKIEDVREKSQTVTFQTVRELLQRIGTDIIRKIDGEWHIRKTIQDINRLPEGTIACVDDIRFKNELEAFRNIGADTFFIIRGNAENISNHESETGLFHSDFPDNRIILNFGSETELCEEFVAEYENNFKITVKTPIFLSEYQDLKNVNRKFGIEKNNLIEEILRQNKQNEIFLKEGLITFRNNSNFKLKEVLTEMSIENTYSYEQRNGRFIIMNPIAYENIKRNLVTH